MTEHRIDKKMWKYIPKKYQPIIDGLWRDEDGVWLILKNGWESKDGGKTFHEDHFKEILFQLRHNTKKTS